MKKWNVGVFIIPIIFLILILLAVGYFVYLHSHLFNISCNDYSSYVEANLAKFNNENPCSSDNDCTLIYYYPCNIYSVNKDFDGNKFYSDLNMSIPRNCGLVSCMEIPEMYQSSCANNRCTMISPPIMK